MVSHSHSGFRFTGKLSERAIQAPYLPYALVPMVQTGFNSFPDFTEEDRQKITWRNAFKLFPTLQAKFPELQ